MQYLYDGTEINSRVYLGDTPGFQDVDGVTVDHINFIINGNVPDKYKVIVYIVTYRVIIMIN